MTETSIGALYEGAESFKTSLGSTLSVRPAPEHLGPGVLVTLDMNQPGDGRHAEVYLAPHEQLSLARMVLPAVIP